MSTAPRTPSPVADAVADWVRNRSVEGPLVVALSGGLDSCVLLHALRFGPSSARAVRAAHFDHGMRTGSGADADWVAGVCRAWSVPLERQVAGRPLRSEADARSARYAFLRGVVAEAGPGATLLTAHHADDQAETVLFRAVRGSGIEGLAGIAAEPEGGPARPLLGVWRDALEAYAAEHGVPWREDATNADPGFARNVLRHAILPVVERDVAPGARRALVRLAGFAGDEAEAWRDALARLMPSLGFVREDGPGGVRRSLDRAAVSGLGAPLRRRVLRHLFGLAGATLDAATVERAARFCTTGRSGRAVELRGGFRLAVELDRLVLHEPSDARPRQEVAGRPLLIPSPAAGAGEVTLDGRRVRVTWGAPTSTGPGVDAAVETFDAASLTFPLQLRGRAPGDRMRTSAGTRKLKKLVLDRRIPSGRRDRLPVLADAAGRVLWVPGVARSEDARPLEGRPRFALRVEG